MGQKSCAKIPIDGIKPVFCILAVCLFSCRNVACLSMLCCCNLARITLHFALNFKTGFPKVSVVSLVLGETSKKKMPQNFRVKNLILSLSLCRYLNQ